MAQTPQRRTIRIRIEGRVQGVAYRAWTQLAAESFALSGWVRNRRDGSVEALFSGAPQDVEAMLEACASGPRNAVVSSIKIVGESEDAPAGFEVRPTA